MLHGRVVRPPSVGATLARVDEASVRAMPGLVRVVVRKNFVGVVAEKPFQAMQIAEKLQVSWAPGPVIPDQATYYDHLRQDRASRDTYLLDSGDVDQSLRAARQVVSATYLHPFHMHGSVGSPPPSPTCNPGRPRYGRPRRRCIRCGTRRRSCSGSSRRTSAWCSRAGRAATASTGPTR
jgi:hypothetical protein